MPIVALLVSTYEAASGKQYCIFNTIAPALQ